MVSSKDGNNSIHISLREVSKIYELGETTVKALDNVSLDVEKGDMILVVGPSGSGKSTLVNMIGGVDQPDKGKIIVNDQRLDKMSNGELTTFRRKYVGFVFQFYSLIPTLTAAENVEMAAELIDLKGHELRNRGKEVLEAVGLKGRGRSYPSQLSGGERQRVALARALAKRPSIILVDEPTGQLDEETGEEMVKLIRDTSKKYGSTTLMVTHDRNLIKFADYMVEMKSGKLKDNR